MSITKDFEKCYDTDNGYPAEWVDALLLHSLALEAMLKKHANHGGEVRGTCLECGSLLHVPDCALAKLLEGVEG